jgi:hypothetical protein
MKIKVDRVTGPSAVRQLPTPVVDVTRVVVIIILLSHVTIGIIPMDAETIKSAVQCGPRRPDVDDIEC